MGDRFQFKFDIYQRHFRKPLHTSHGIWRTREGIIISLKNDRGKIARGEIAPLPSFGSETIGEALQFCQQLKTEISPTEIETIPDTLPACQFAFESALVSLLENNNLDNDSSLKYCYLLPAGKEALTAWQAINRSLIELENPQPETTFKWKIGVYPLAEEIDILRQLIKELPAKSKLRLDANGGLNLPQAQKLLTITDNLPKIEFIEQPLSPENFTDIMTLSRDYKTPLALDESVANLNQLKNCYQQGWRGIVVIKGAIAGSPQKLRQFCQQHPIDAVFSSVFETNIGRQAVLQLARELGNSDRAVGFGVKHWLN